jgi:hypothetical protein
MNSIQIGNRTFLSAGKITIKKGHLIVLEDGTFIDIQTGQMSNSGMAQQVVIYPPFESLDQHENLEETGPKEFCEKFNSTNLAIDTVPNAAVQVIPYDESEITVLINGPSNAVDAIKVVKVGETIRIQDSESLMSQIVSGYGSITRVTTLNMDARDVEVNGMDMSMDMKADKEVDIIVKVPKGTSVQLLNSWYSAEIGDIEGHLTIQSSCSAAVNVGIVRNAHLEVNSRGNISVSQTNGSVKIENNGSGNIVVAGGIAHPLLVNNSSRGIINYRGNAKDVEVKQTGSGEVQIQQVEGYLKVKIGSSGGLNISQILNLENLKIANSGSGNVTIGNGHSRRAVLEVSSRGGIRYEGSADEINMDNSGSGDIFIKDGEASSLKIDLSSQGSAKFGGSSSSIKLKSAGSGEILVFQATGKVKLGVSSRGGITIEESAITSLEFDGSGSGNIVIKKGTIQQINGDLSSRGNLKFPGTVTNADLDLSGSGNVELGKVIGILRNDESSRGRVIVREK